MLVHDDAVAVFSNPLFLVVRVNYRSQKPIAVVHPRTHYFWWTCPQAHDKTGLVDLYVIPFF